jgi:formamidopyrimidine-DNA glycosylase
MPELPEVETVRRALAHVLEQHYVVDSFVGRGDLRWPLPENLAARLIGRRFISIDRRGKYLLMQLDQQDILLLHLGMSGSIRIHDSPFTLGKHDHIMLAISANPSTAAKHYVVLNDPRRFGWVDLFPAAHQFTHKLLRHMGPEPLGNAFSAAYLQMALKDRLGMVKNVLLNQQVIAGIGNIYASESLFHAGISPRRKAATIKGQRAERLAAAVVTTLRAAIEDGGTSLRDHVQPGGEIGYFVQRLAVYGRTGQPCKTCTTPIKMIVQSGRSSFYCPSCQG